MIKPSFLFCFFLLIIASAKANQEHLLSIAVNDLQGKGVEKHTAEIVSDRLRSQLLSTDVFRVMERNEMDNVLKEQGFQKTGACDESTCLIEIGQLLGVKYMVAGSIGKIKKLYTISLRMVVVATGQIMFTVDEDYEGDIKGVLSDMVESAAQNLAHMAMSEKVVLQVGSEPEGADVFINKRQAGKTPFISTNLKPGNYSLRITMNNYMPIEEQIIIDKNITVSKKYKLKHTKSYIDSMKVVRAASRKKRQTVRRIVFGTLSASALGAGLYFNSALQKGCDEQNAIQRRYDGATDNFDTYKKKYSSQEDENKSHALKRNIMYGLAGACAAGLIISIPF